MIPAYNEEQAIGHVIKETLHLYPNYDLIVIDDGSTDDTAKIAGECGARVVSFPYHLGGNATIITGYKIALLGNYDFLVKIDGDGQHPPSAIQRVLHPIIDGLADVTIGSRRLGKSERDSAIKGFGRSTTAYLVSKISGIKITDATSGLRAWNKRALQKLFNYYLESRVPDDSIFWVVETLVARRLGLRLIEVPVEMRRRVYGVSKSFTKRKMITYPSKMIATVIKELFRRNRKEV